MVHRQGRQEGWKNKTNNKCLSTCCVRDTKYNLQDKIYKLNDKNFRKFTIETCKKTNKLTFYWRILAAKVKKGNSLLSFRTDWTRRPGESRCCAMTEAIREFSPWIGRLRHSSASGTFDIPTRRTMQQRHHGRMQQVYSQHRYNLPGRIEKRLCLVAKSNLLSLLIP